jgi:hypothetical protein
MVGALTFPPASPSFPKRGKEGRGRSVVGGMLAIPHAMVARVRYVPNEKSGFLFRLLQ